MLKPIQQQIVSSFLYTGKNGNFLKKCRCRWLFLATASTRASNNYIIIINLRVAIGFVTPTLAFFDQCSHMFKPSWPYFCNCFLQFKRSPTACQNQAKIKELVALLVKKFPIPAIVSIFLERRLKK